MLTTRVVPDGIGVEQRQRPRRAAPPRRCSSRATRSSACRRASPARRTWPRRRRRGAASATSGTWSDAGANPLQNGDAPPACGEREAADGDEMPARRRRRPPRPARATPARRRGSAPAPARLQRPHAAERGERRPPAIGLLEAEPRLAGPPRRDGDRRGVDVARERRRYRGERLAGLPCPADSPRGRGDEPRAIEPDKPAPIGRPQGHAGRRIGRLSQRPKPRGRCSSG